MYILVNKSCMLLGIFTSKKKLDIAIQAMKTVTEESFAYYAKVEANTFDSLLPNFWTMHSEKLTRVEL